MKFRINPFLLAHGATSGPNMFPQITGLISGIISLFFAIGLLIFMEGQDKLENQFVPLSVYLTELLFGIIAGILYGKIYRRAALDIKGGWMFGMSFGFFLWMTVFAGLGTLIFGEPLVTGQAAVVIFSAHLFFGFLMGLLFPIIHNIIAHKICKK